MSQQLLFNNNMFPTNLQAKSKTSTQTQDQLWPIKLQTIAQQSLSFREHQLDVTIKHQNVLEQTVHIARTWLGTPFHPQGRKKGVGCDCLGLILKVGDELTQTSFIKAKICNPYDYNYLDDSPKLKGYLDAYFKPVPNFMQVGNIILIQLTQFLFRLALIVGLEDGEEVLDNQSCYIIHACSSLGKVCENRLPKSWYNKIIGAWQFPL